MSEDDKCYGKKIRVKQWEVKGYSFDYWKGDMLAKIW